MRNKLMTLADQKLQDGDRSGAIKAIEVFYALAEAEEQAARMLWQLQTSEASPSSSSAFEKNLAAREGRSKPQLYRAFQSHE